MNSTFIIGAGGLGREVAAMLLNSDYDKSELYFIDDNLKKGTQVNGVEVWGSLTELIAYPNEAQVFLAVGSAEIKKKILKQLIQDEATAVNPKLSFPNFIHKSAQLEQREFIKLGKGNIICQGALMTTNITLGSFNLVNRYSTLSHDTVIGNNCIIMPGVHISGGAKVGNYVYIGTGAVIALSTFIQNNARIEPGEIVG